MKKRYLVFIYDSWETGNGGFRNLRGDFDTLDEVRDCLKENLNNEHYDVYDNETRTLIYEEEDKIF